MDGVIIMLIATLALSGSMFIVLQAKIHRRHRENNFRFYRNNL